MAAAALLYYSFASNVRSSLVGTVIILSGLPVYYYIRATNNKKRVPDEWGA
jgi:hypothetical protein